MSAPKVDLGALGTALAEAREVFDAADREEMQARSIRTGALNRLNAAQKALDAAVEALRKDAPRETDWRSAERRKIEVPA